MAIFVQSVARKADHKSVKSVLDWAGKLIAYPPVDASPKVIEAYRKGNVAYVVFRAQDGTTETLKYWDRKKEPKPRAKAKKATLVRGITG